MKLFNMQSMVRGIWLTEYRSRYSRMDQVKFVEDSLKKSEVVCLGRPYYFKFFIGCLSQILLGPFLNTLSHINQEHQISTNLISFIQSIHMNSRGSSCYKINFVIIKKVTFNSMINHCWWM